MNIEQEARQPNPSAYIELFELTLKHSGEVYRYTPMKSNEIIRWNYNDYYPFPIHIEGISFSSTEAPARPTLSIANVLPGRLFATLAFLHGDLVGSSVIFRRLFANYLGNSSSVSLTPLRFTIRRKLQSNNKIITFELGSPLDRERGFLPTRQMLKRDFPALGIVKQA